MDNPLAEASLYEDNPRTNCKCGAALILSTNRGHFWARKKTLDLDGTICDEFLVICVSDECDETYVGIYSPHSERPKTTH